MKEKPHSRSGAGCDYDIIYYPYLKILKHCNNWIAI